MPRKRRPTPPLPGSIVRNLAPKPDPSHGSTDTSSDKNTVLTASSSRQSTAGSDNDSSPCGVPQCTTPNCRLATHINYGRQRKQFLLQSTRAPSRSPSSTSSLTEASSRLAINSTMDVRLSLPIEDTPNQDFQKLFVYFFDTHFDNMMLVFRPQLRDHAFKKSIHRLALHNSVYCLTLVAQAHMSFLKDGLAMPPSITEDLTDTIYTRLLKMTREKIEFFDLDDVDVLLMAIVVLCEYDLQLHQYDALSTHSNGMKALVTKRGGIHNLGLSLPYVLRMDRFLAIRSNQLPQFASPDISATNTIAQSIDDDPMYGASLQETPSVFAEQVRSVCADSAHLLELMDDLPITFDLAQIPEISNPKMEYFYFLRENIEVRHTILNHQISRSNANIINRLGLCAGQLVTYYIAQNNYLPLVSDLLVTRIWNMLTNPSYDSARSPTITPERNASDAAMVPKIDLAAWKNNMHILLWLLFVCALPSARSAARTFTGHLSSSLPTRGTSGSPTNTSGPRTSPTSRSQPPQSITSPSSPRRDRYLPAFILYVAEHLIGERPLSGTSDWDTEVIEILQSYVWAGDRLKHEYEIIVRRVHERVMARAADEA